MRVQRYKGVGVICRRYGDIWENEDDTREQRVYVEGYRDIWENKDDTREQRVYVEGYGDIWENKDDTRKQGVHVARRVRGYTGEQRRYKRGEGICRICMYMNMQKGTGKYGRIKTIQESRGDMQKGMEIYESTKAIQESRGYMQKGMEIYEYKDDTREQTRNYFE